MLWLRTTCIAILLIALGSAESACAVGMNQYIFRNGLLKGLPDLDQSSVQFYDGQLRGLTDSNGRQILPAIYANLSYCGHGIFLATETNPRHKFYFNKKRHIFNRDGAELPVTMPEDAVLLNIFSFGPKADADQNLELTQLDPNTILLFALPDNREGLCDTHGTIILPTLPGEIRYVSTSSAYVDMPNIRYVIDLKTGERTPNKGGHSPGVFPVPRLPWPREGPEYMVKLPQDRQIITIARDDGLFDKEYWTEYTGYPISHLAMFNRFLHEHNLIGMSEGEVASYLEPRRSADKKTLVCALPKPGCTPGCYGIRMYLQEGKVEKWCFFAEERESEPITSNVIIQDMSPRSRLLNWGIGDRQGTFPKISPKTDVR